MHILVFNQMKIYKVTSMIMHFQDDFIGKILFSFLIIYHAMKRF